MPSSCARPGGRGRPPLHGHWRCKQQVPPGWLRAGVGMTSEGSGMPSSCARPGGRGRPPLHGHWRCKQQVPPGWLPAGVGMTSEGSGMPSSCARPGGRGRPPLHGHWRCKQQVPPGWLLRGRRNDKRGIRDAVELRSTGRTRASGPTRTLAMQAGDSWLAARGRRNDQASTLRHHLLRLTHSSTCSDFVIKDATVGEHRSSKTRFPADRG